MVKSGQIVRCPQTSTTLAARLPVSQAASRIGPIDRFRSGSQPGEIALVVIGPPGAVRNPSRSRQRCATSQQLTVFCHLTKFGRILENARVFASRLELVRRHRGAFPTIGKLTTIHVRRLWQVDGPQLAAQ